MQFVQLRLALTRGATASTPGIRFSVSFAKKVAALSNFNFHSSCQVLCWQELHSVRKRMVRKHSAVHAARKLVRVTLCLVPLQRDRGSRAECWQLNRKWMMLHIVMAGAVVQT
jgi:hypothetical protein